MAQIDIRTNYQKKNSYAERENSTKDQEVDIKRKKERGYSDQEVMQVNTAVMLNEKNIVEFSDPFMSSNQ